MSRVGFGNLVEVVDLDEDGGDLILVLGDVLLILPVPVPDHRGHEDVENRLELDVVAHLPVPVNELGFLLELLHVERATTSSPAPAPPPSAWMDAVTNASGEKIDAAQPDALGAEEVELGGAESESGELRHALGEVLDPEGDREVRHRVCTDATPSAPCLIGPNN